MIETVPFKPLDLSFFLSPLSHTHQAQFREEIPHTEATFSLVPAYLTHTHTHTIVVRHLHHVESFRVFWIADASCQSDIDMFFVCLVSVSQQWSIDWAITQMMCGIPHTVRQLL